MKKDKQNSIKIALLISEDQDLRDRMSNLIQKERNSKYKHENLVTVGWKFQPSAWAVCG